MRYSTTAIILAAMYIGESVAKPTHVHHHRREKNSDKVDWDTLNWSDMGVDWKEAYEAGEVAKTSKTSVKDAAAQLIADKPVANTPAATTPAATNTAPSADYGDDAAAGATSPTSTPTSTPKKGDSLLDDIEDLFDHLVGVSNSRKTFGAVVAAAGGTTDFYMGNYGSPYGSNIIKADPSATYSYTAKFCNTQKEPITVNIWNKVGPNLQPLSGAALAPKKTTLTIVIRAGDCQTVAFDEDSQVAWAQACPKTTYAGSYDTTWGEAQFRKSGSGYDMSAIMNSAGNKYNMSITSKEAPGCTSDPTQNYWLTDKKPIGNSDGSCFISQSTATLTVLMGGPM